MSVDGIPRIDGVRQTAGVGQKAPIVAGQTFGRVEQMGLRAHEAASPVQKPAGASRQGAASSASPADQNTKEVRGADETYVRIRYDKPTQTYVIQVRSATSDEVISEFPPDAWARFSGDMPLPKGMIVEKKQ